MERRAKSPFDPYMEKTIVNSWNPMPAFVSFSLTVFENGKLLHRCNSTADTRFEVNGTVTL